MITGVKKAIGDFDLAKFQPLHKKVVKDKSEKEFTTSQNQPVFINAESLLHPAQSVLPLLQTATEKIAHKNASAAYQHNPFIHPVSDVARSV